MKLLGNPLGTWTLFKKEVRRFLKVYNQTLLAPVITSLLFLAIFNLSIGSHVESIGGIPYAEFMASGLIIMTIVQQVFANASSTFIMGKVLGNMVDVLMPPISAGEIVLAITTASIFRGLIVGILTGLTVSISIDYHIEHVLVMVIFGLLAATMLALLGLLAGVLADTFDQMAAITSYIITPLSFLSGTFYSIKNLPETWQMVAHANPFFWMIDGFRYGITGMAEGDWRVAMLRLFVINIMLWTVVYKLIKNGYRIKT